MRAAGTGAPGPWRPTAAAAAALGLAAAVLCGVPLFDLLGYEACLVLSLLQVPVSLTLGARAAARHARPFAALTRAWAATTLALLAPLTLLLLNAWRVPNCNVGRGLAFFAALPWASACYGATLGVAVRRACCPVHGTPSAAAATPPPGRGHRAAYAAGLVCAAALPLAWALGRLYALPSINAYSHLWGYFSGSIYDENVVVDGRLLAFRAATAVRVAALVALVWLQLPPRRTAALLLVGGVGFVAAEQPVAARLGYAVDRAQLRRVLPQEICAEGVRLHLPAALPGDVAARLARDHAFRLAQAQRRLALPPRPAPIDSWVFASAADKAAWTGGAGTMVAKPWLGEIYLHGTEAPHPLVSHELVHVLVAAWSRAPLAIAWRGALPNVGLIEGVAEAAGVREMAFAPQHVAACLWPSGTQARLLATFGGSGSQAAPFWAQPGPRAYAEAGAFVRYLLRAHGPAPLAQVYAGAAWQAAYGAPLTELLAAFAAQLPQPSEAACVAVRASFRQRSVFARTCAHEIATLKAQRDAAAPEAAVALQRRIVHHLAGDTEEAVALAGRLLVLDTPAATAEATRLLAAVDAAAPGDTVAAALQAIAALEARRGRLAAAAAALARAQARVESPALRRALQVRAWALTLTPPLATDVAAYLDGRSDAWTAATTLSEPSLAADATASYLLGRRLVLQGAYGPALRVFARGGPHPDAAMEIERLRLVALATWQQGAEADADAGTEAASYAAAATLAAALADLERRDPDGPGAALAADWRDRLAWSQTHPDRPRPPSPAPH